MLKQISLKSTLLVLVCGASICGLARADEHKQINIPAGDLITALKTLAQQSGIELVYRSEELEGLHTRGVAGSLSAQEAVTKLIQGTALTVRTDSSGAVLIARPHANKPAQTPANEPTQTPAAEKHSADDSRAEPTAAVEGGSEGPEVTGRQTDTRRNTVEEIVVTAQKRQERLQDVPESVTAVTSEALLDWNQKGLQDYFSSFAGLTFASGNRGDTFPVIRGVSTGPYTNSTVGIVIDDIPYGGSIGAFQSPDIDPSDLESIEVLRGPQGTLYGASSLGGLIKYVTAEPSTAGTSGRLEVGTESVHNGSQLGSSARGSFNVPLGDTLAFRASGFVRKNPGYIDNPVRQIDGVNESYDSGGLFAALWRPSAAFSLKLSGLVQHSNSDGSNYVFVNPGFGDLQQNYLPGGTGNDSRDSVLGATIKAKVAGVEMTSITGYSEYKHVSKADLSTINGATVQKLFGVNGVYFSDALSVQKVSEEIRLFASLGEHVDWLLGGFYTSESLDRNTDYQAVNSALTESFFYGSISAPFDYHEYAAFADLTLHLTDRFSIQAGGRKSYIQQPGYAQLYTGQRATVSFGSNPFSQSIPSTDSSPTTYLFTTQYKVSEELMGYFRTASGFQPGGANTNPTAGVPPTYKPNTTETYEVGTKGTVLERVLSFDVSLYHIKWKDLPTLIVNPVTAFSYRINAGEAKSQGAEVSVQSRPLTGFTVAGWAAWGDAKLTRAVSPGAPGDQLPYSTRFSANLSLEQRFPLPGSLSGVVGAMWSYVGEREGDFQPAPTQRQVFPAYSKFDLRAGAEYESWKLNLFVNNVADKRGETGGGLDTGVPPFPVLYIEPRTVGLTVSKVF